jgi:hypothetical protein
MEQTAATRWLLRPLGIIKRHEKLSTSVIRDFGFVDAYVKDKYHETDYSHPLHLLFKQDHAMTSFRDFIQSEYERGLLLEDYDYPEGYIVLLYDYPDVFKSDYDKILRGEYSKTSKDFQACFPDNVIVDGEKQITMYYRTFNKSEDLREALEKKYGFKLPEQSEVWKSPYVDEVPDVIFVDDDGLLKHLKDEVPSETLDINKFLNYE